VKGVRFRLVLLGAPLIAALPACGRRDAATPDQRRAAIAALEKERDELRERIDALLVHDEHLDGMPSTGVRFGIPTSLARTLVERVITGFVDQVTLELRNLKVHKAGRVRKVVTLGEYVLDVRIDEVRGRLRTGSPEIVFGGDQVSVALPIRIASGTGNAVIDFKWDGKNVAGAVCGDMEISQTVAGSVRPDTYPVEGSLVLSASAHEILASPRFPRIRVNLKVQPSAESWAAVQKILDEKEGLCGFVLDKVDIPGVLEGLIGRGFGVRLPTEKLKPMAVPVGIEPTMTIRGRVVAVGVTVSSLAITEHMIWLGADVDVTAEPDGGETEG